MPCTVHLLGRTGRATILFGFMALACDGVSGPAVPETGAVSAVEVSPHAVALFVGQSRRLKATTRDAGGTVVNPAVVTWSSSDTNVVKIEWGVLVGVGVGSATVIATSGDAVGRSQAKVTLVPVAVVDVTPSSATTAVGLGERLTAVAKDSAGETLSGRSIIWSTSDTSVVRVDSNGVAIGVGKGTATVIAASEGRSGEAQMTVTGPAPEDTLVALVTTQPANASLVVGGTLRFSATVQNAAGALLVGRPITWSSGNPAATIASNGQATAVAAGVATITASTGGKSGQAQLTVTNPPPPPPPDTAAAAVSVTPSASRLLVTETAPLSTVLRNEAGSILQGKAVTWSSSNPLSAAVDGGGRVTGLLPGSSTITAKSDGKSGQALVVVTLAPVPVVGAYPNEPAGFTPVAENDFLMLPVYPGTPTGLLGKWFEWPDPSPYLSIVNVPDAPQSPPSVIQTRFPAGWVAGSSPAIWNGWDQPYGGTPLKRQYLSLWFRIPGTDYENQMVGSKILYLGYGQDTSTALNSAFLIIEGNGSQIPQSSFTLGFWQQNIVARNIHQNVDLSPRMTVGSWHHFELLLGLNTVGAANGTLKWWVDGSLIMDYADVVYITADAPVGFQNIKFDPVWGGQGGAKARDDYFQVDHLYVSGVQ